jgi:hypothetical protein
MPPEGHTVTWLSRVMDKSAMYTAALLEDLYTLVDWSHTRVFNFWSDAGPHFRCLNLLKFLAIDTQRLTGVDTIRCHFGLEKHFKNMCDSHFAILNMRKKEAASQVCIATLDDMANAYREHYQEAKTRRPELAKETIKVFMPRLRDTYNSRRLKADSLGGQITMCHCWEFRLNDRRRKDNLFGRGAQASIATAITAKAVYLPGARGHFWQNSHPQLQPLKPPVPLPASSSGAASSAAAPAPAPAAALEPEEEDEILQPGVTTMVQDGWRLSYVQHENTHCPNPEQFIPKLTKKFNAHAPFQHLFPPATRHRSSAEILLAQMQSDERLKKRARDAAHAASGV